MLGEASVNEGDVEHFAVVSGDQLVLLKMLSYGDDKFAVIDLAASLPRFLIRTERGHLASVAVKE
jgi:hypothetical protein